MHSFLNGIRKYMHKEPIVVGPGIRTGISVKAENLKRLALIVSLMQPVLIMNMEGLV